MSELDDRAEVAVDIIEATPERWTDVRRFFGSTSRCWCRRFFAAEDEDAEEALRREVAESGTAPGLLAMIGGEPAGWTRVMPRDAIPGVVANRALRRLLPPDPDAHWVTCIVVRRPFRGVGVGRRLLAAAVGHAAARGAARVEGHPVDVQALTTTPSPTALFTGTLSMFRAVGFEEVGRTFRSRPVMRLEPATAPVRR